MSAIFRAIDAWSWLVMSAIIPIIVAWNDGSSYAFAFSVTGVGLGLYFVTALLIRMYIQLRAPETLDDDTWEYTAGTGTVPKWVSAAGLVGMGFVPAGLVVAALLWTGTIINRGGG